MALDPDHCDTCAALADGGIDVESDGVEGNTRRLSASVAIVTEGRHVFRNAGEARRHPVALRLWGGGLVELVLEADTVTVTKVDAMAWDFVEPRLVHALREYLRLEQARGSGAHG